MSLKNKLKNLAKGFGYSISKDINYDPVMNQDKVFNKIYLVCKKYSMTPKERMYSLYLAVKYIIQSDIPGDFVECGVWAGGSSMLVALTLNEMNCTNRRIWLYDTFEGMTKPTKEDITTFNKEHVGKTYEAQKKFGGWCAVNINLVKNNLNLTKYPIKNIEFVKGKVEDTIPKRSPKKIALLRLDTDWYDSTKHELKYLFPILSKKGVLLIDDYGHFDGARKATDEFFKRKNILLNRIDYSARIGVKI